MGAAETVPTGTAWEGARSPSGYFLTGFLTAAAIAAFFLALRPFSFRLRLRLSSFILSIMAALSPFRRVGPRQPCGLRRPAFG